MRLFWVIVFCWLVIGALAGTQRHYYRASSLSCSGAGTIAVTIVAGPLNYLGGDPRLICR
jgi:hypothetical protein